MNIFCKKHYHILVFEQITTLEAIIHILRATVEKDENNSNAIIREILGETALKFLRV